MFRFAVLIIICSVTISSETSEYDSSDIIAFDGATSPILDMGIISSESAAKSLLSDDDLQPMPMAMAAMITNVIFFMLLNFYAS